MSWLKQLFVRRRLYGDLSEEIREHLEEKIEQLVAGGTSRKEAAAAARREFGNVMLVEEDSREVWRWPSAEDFLVDLRYGLRLLRKNFGSTVAVVITLALGIGMNTTVFGFVNALLLRPPVGVKAPNKLLELWLHIRSSSSSDGYLPLTYPDYLYYRDHNQSFDGMLAFDGDPHSIIWNRSGEGQIVQAQLVSGNFFSLLGVNAVLGRTFSVEDDQVESPQPVVVLGHAFWQQRFDSDPSIVGKGLLLNGANYRVVGVASAGFAGLEAGIEPDVWAPVTMVERITGDKGRLNNWHGHWLFAVGRLKDNASARGARAELGVLARQIEQAQPDQNRKLDGIVFPATLVPGPYRGYVSAFTGLLMGVFALLLFIASANAASFLLARATGRTREMAIRSALGAGRGRLIRQLLVESTLLSGLAGCAGLVLAYWVAPLLLTLKPASLPITLRLPVDWRVLIFTVLISLVTGLAFGITPALRSAKVQVAPILKDEGQSASYRKSQLRSVLITGQTATCAVLLVGATLCVKSFRNARLIDPGFDTQHVAVATLTPEVLGYREPQVRAFYEQLSEHIRALPGVSSASFVSHLPLGAAREQTVVTRGIRSTSDQDKLSVDVLRIAPNYFRTMGIPLLRGRDFTAREDAELRGAAIINETLARRLSPNRDPVGQRIAVAGEKVNTEIIGVVKTGKYRTLGEDAIPAIFLPQLPPRRTLVVRTAGDPASMLGLIRREIQIVDSNMAATELETIRQYMALPLFPARTTGLLLGASGILALALTCIGLFGVISYIVSQRTHEIGVRIALGARPRDVLKLVVRHGLFLTATGLAVGLGVAFGAAHLLLSLLYGISPTDPGTFAGVALLLCTVALLACYVPARRATHVDPTVALRYE